MRCKWKGRGAKLRFVTVRLEQKLMGSVNPSGAGRKVWLCLVFIIAGTGKFTNLVKMVTQQRRV